MKTSVWANVLEEGQEKGKRPSQVARKQTRKEAELPRNYPETTQKLPRNKTLRLRLYRKELSSFCFRIHMQDVKK